MTQPDPPDDLQLPPSIELAWGLREVGSRGPRRALMLEQIVAAGIAVAQGEGVGALSMARIAKELGVGTMSLYRYVAAKDELLTIMVDTALGTPPPPAPGEDWRAGLTRWAVGVRTAYQRHPWALRVPISGPPLGPNNVAWLDNALDGARGHAAHRAGEALDGPAGQRVRAQRGDADRRLRRGVGGRAGDARLRPRCWPVSPAPSSFPALHRAIASGSLDDPDDIDAEFNFGLERILDGVAALMATKRRRR